MPKKLKRLAIHDLCRICLTERGHLRNIIGTKIPSMIEYCASVQVKEDDDLPKQICVSCFHQIAKLYTFKKKMERSDRILRKYAKQCRNVEDVLGKAVSDAEIDDCPSDEEKITIVEEKVVFADCRSEEEKITIVEEKIVFGDGPPPLIPIQPKPVDKPNGQDTVVKVVKDAPPLVPLKVDSVELNLECTVCGEFFNSIARLKQHRLEQCQAPALQCNICKKDFKERKKLIGHLKGHMVMKDYACKICGKRYPNPSTFRVHMRTHTGERPFKCQVCNKGFVRWAGVVGHMKTHNAVKPYACETCGKAFKIASNLERHKILHSGSFPFCCNFCGKTFSQSDNLQLHIRSYHTFEKPFLCSVCGKGFVSSTRLNRHMWVHSGHKPYQCKDCPKAYSNSNDLKRHSRMHSGGATDKDKPHACDVCKMRFFHACRLARHMKSHARKQCDRCDSSFKTERNLVQHIEAKHSGEKDEEEYVVDGEVQNVYNLIKYS